MSLSKVGSWVVCRPLVLGSRERDGRTEWCVASEDCAFGPIGFQRVRDVAPGEMIVISGMVHNMAGLQTYCCPRVNPDYK